MNAVRSSVVAELESGRLELFLEGDASESPALLGFAARCNPRRSFLFVSKVLGKHWPARPAAMKAAHDRLAAGLTDLAGPVLFVGMAETATGLGHGIHDSWVEATGRADALYLHTTRYPVDGSPRLTFEEAHCHSPEVFLHIPGAPELHALFRDAKTLVLVDDEISTGDTLANLARALAGVCPALEQIRLVSLTDLRNETQRRGFAGRAGVPALSSSLLRGHFQFEHRPEFETREFRLVQGDRSPRREGLCRHLGRLGIRGRLELAPAAHSRMRACLGRAGTVLVLGTGEFMHAAFLVARALEAEGRACFVQGTTRSPILEGADIRSRLVISDTYGDGIDNYLYNVAPGAHDAVLVVHETPVTPGLASLAERLGAHLFDLGDETALLRRP